MADIWNASTMVNNTFIANSSTARLGTVSPSSVFASETSVVTSPTSVIASSSSSSPSSSSLGHHEVLTLMASTSSEALAVAGDDYPLMMFDNSNFSSIFSHLDYLPDDLPADLKSALVFAYVTIIVMAVLGNLLVIVIIVGHRKMRTVTNVFLVSLAVSDTLIAAVNMPFQLNFYVQNEWTMGETLCKLTKYIQGVVIVSSIFTLTGIAVDR